MPLDSSLFGPAVDAANRYGVPPDFFLAQINQESGFNPSAYNQSSGATGIAQILGSTAANPGYGIAPVDPNDPIASLDFAAHYDSVLYGRTGSYTGVLNSYGTGTNNPAGEIASALDGSGTGLGSGAGSGATNAGFFSPDNPLSDKSICNNVPGFSYLFPSFCDDKTGGQSSKQSGSWNQWFVRGAVVLVALIFVFVGLNGFIRTGRL